MSTGAPIPVGGVTFTFTLSKNGLVPAPTTASGKFLRDDGSWASVGSTGISGALQPIIATLDGGM